jgi:hypothetical protein
MQSPLIDLKFLHISTTWECKALRVPKESPWLARNSEVGQIKAKPRIETLKMKEKKSASEDSKNAKEIHHASAYHK